MAGLLDPKSRVLDTIITPEGRRQMFSGGMRIAYATFSDIGFPYDGDSSNAFVSSSICFNLESFSTSNDTIFPVTNDSGQLLEYSGDSTSLTPAGTVLVRDTSLVDDVGSTISQVVSESLKNQQIASTLDIVRKDEGLSSDLKAINFTITEDRPFDGEPSVTSITDADSLFADKRLSKLPNFMFLPPIQSSGEIGSKPSTLGDYTSFAETNDIDDGSFFANLNELEDATINLSRLTEYNDLAIQMYETAGSNIKKLDVIKYGRVGISPEGSSTDLYFVGKVFFDGFDVPTFINIFTLVIE
jgi:hypothetical protein